MQTIDLELPRQNAITGIESGILRLKWLAAATRLEIALRQHDWNLKYGFNPDQPRVPRGNPDGGEWTKDESRSNARLIRLAGEIPTNDTPEIPKERPPTSRERSAALKIAARLLKQFGGPVGTIVEIGSWAYKYSPLVQAYNDPPKTLDELRQSVSTPALGYDIHHIVEQTQAEREGFTREQIDSPENLTRIPTMRHWEINAWYQRENRDFGGQTPREYLSGRSWEVRKAVGLEALRIHEVLRP